MLMLMWLKHVKTMPLLPPGNGVTILAVKMVMTGDGANGIVLPRLQHSQHI